MSRRHIVFLVSFRRRRTRMTFQDNEMIFGSMATERRPQSPTERNLWPVPRVLQSRGAFVAAL